MTQSQLQYQSNQIAAANQKVNEKNAESNAKQAAAAMMQAEAARRKSRTWYTDVLGIFGL